MYKSRNSERVQVSSSISCDRADLLYIIKPEMNPDPKVTPAVAHAAGDTGHGPGIFQYLKQQSAAMVTKLYGSRGSAVVNLTDEDSTQQTRPDSQAPFVTKAVFQSLTAMAKNYVLRLLFVSSGHPSTASSTASAGTTEDEMRMWAIPSGSGSGSGSGNKVGAAAGAQHATAVEELVALHVLQPVTLPNSAEGEGDRDGEGEGEGGSGTGTGAGAGAERTVLVMNPHFRRSLQRALLSPLEPWGDVLLARSAAPAVQEQNMHVPTKAELEALSAAKWDALLRFLVGIGADSASLNTSAASAAGRIYSTTSLVVKAGGTIERFVRRMGLMSEGGTPVAASNGHNQAFKKAKAGTGNLQITALGYAYMLRSYQEQVWMFVYELISAASTSSATSSGTGQEQLLSLLFMLSYCEFGRGYPFSELSADQQNLMLEFSQLGLCFVSGPSDVNTAHAASILDRGTLYSVSDVRQNSPAVWLFYPSSIAINMLFRSHEPSSQSLSSTTRVGQEFNGAAGAGGLSSGMGKSEEEESSTGNIHRGVSGISSSGDTHKEAVSSLSSGLEIIVETNMQVIAYLRSPLHLALLGLFVELSVHLPNVAIGTITRERAKAAFRMGVRVSQIVDFLCVHAHPLTRAAQPIIPTNVVDQLVLWENERLRVTDTPAILMKFDEIPNFGPKEFADVDAYARRIGMNLCASPATMSLVVPYEGYEALRAYVEDTLL